MDPHTPEFGYLRPAVLNDVPRLAVVATGGFRYSPVFEWERPYHETYPEDTLASYRAIFAEMIKDPKYIVLGARDFYDPSEDKKTKAILPPNKGTSSSIKGESVIVGVACWKLEPGSRRIGQFQGDRNRSSDFSKGPQRDESGAHIVMLDRECDVAERKYFQGHSLMEMVVVHPAYWKRGHGSSLVRWGMALADADQVQQGVFAADMGAKLYLKLGYNKICDIHADGDEKDPGGITNIVARYRPKVPKSPITQKWALFKETQASGFLHRPLNFIRHWKNATLRLLFDLS